MGSDQHFRLWRVQPIAALEWAAPFWRAGATAQQAFDPIQEAVRTERPPSVSACADAIQYLRLDFLAEPGTKTVRLAGQMIEQGVSSDERIVPAERVVRMT